MNRHGGCSILCALGLALLPTISLAQSINIDFGSAGTAPSASYAAAGLAGAWNTIGVLPNSVRAPLVGLDGSSSAAEIYMIASGTALRVEDDPSTSGDDAALVDDMLIGNNNPIDVSKVDVSMDGIELQDREFLAAIKEKREPNASVAQVLPAMKTLDRLEKSLKL